MIPKIYVRLASCPRWAKTIWESCTKIVQRHIQKGGLLNASQFGFSSRHSMTLHCMRFTDQMTLNFNSTISAAAVFLDVEKAFDTTCHPDFLYKLSKFEFSSSVIKVFISFLSQRKFRVSVEGEMPTTRKMQAEVPQVPSCSQHCTVCI
jgi:hypothetical protein